MSANSGLVTPVVSAPQRTRRHVRAEADTNPMGTPATPDTQPQPVHTPIRPQVPDAPFDGLDYEPDRDHRRLSTQLGKIFDLMADGKWRTLDEIEAATGAPASSVSAQLRHLRKPRFGGHTVEKEHLDGGLFHYRVIPAPSQAASYPQTQAMAAKSAKINRLAEFLDVLVDAGAIELRPATSTMGDTTVMMAAAYCGIDLDALRAEQAARTAEASRPAPVADPVQQALL